MAAVRLWRVNLLRVPTTGSLGYLLIPGAGLGTWLWDPIVSELKAPALPVPMPGRGGCAAERRRLTLAAAADEVADAARAWEPERFVLVGHSLGGVLVPEVARRLSDRVAGLAFVGALVPADGERGFDLQTPFQRLLIRFLGAVRPRGVKPPASALRKELCNDLDDPATAAVVERFEPVPEAPRLYRDRVSWDGVPGVPRHYVQLLRDESVPPARQERMAAAIGAELATMETGHLPMLSRPAELAAILSRVASG
jgi:pimeloyl-ACP methyl ester carboxylesterase